MIYRHKQNSLLKNIGKHEISGYLVFRSATSPFYKKLMPEGFGHVFCVIEHPRCNLLIDGAISHAHASVIDKHYPEEGETVLRFKRLIDVNQASYRIGLISCVELIKSFIGLNEFFIFTPKQLYRRLQNG